MKKILLSLAVVFSTISVVNSQVVYTNLETNPVVIDATNMEYALNFFGGEEEFMIQNYSAEGEAVYFASFATGSGVISTQADYNANVEALAENTVISENSTFFGCEDGSPYFNVLYLPSTFETWKNYFEPMFIGFKFTNAGNTYYGWAKVGVNAVENSTTQVKVTLYGYAYQSTPNTLIRAGQTTDLGLSEQNANTLSVYPNPAKDVLNINADNIQSVSIFNAMGQKVYNSANSDGNINISNLENGVYFLNVLSNGVVLKQRFIKE
ncbi:MAG: T9SS type A sorting domain-containing protein [Bacteroidales bacterium]|nr:T9SS type A sorting domain-containing protein [Bacteroidales bacterium]